jgi:hypothetical protein
MTRLVLIVAAAALLFSCADSRPPVLVGAGDIAACDTNADEVTSRLLDEIEGTVFTLGDNAYVKGTAREFARCYEPTWGRHKERTRPALGNHDYADKAAEARPQDASAYFAYFGVDGYYSYDLGAWHIVVLDSNCIPAGGCEAGSPQERWLRADLAAHPTDCLLAYWHHPYFGPQPWVEGRALWEALYEHGADVALNGHWHWYERFAPQDPGGMLDPRGIRQFTVGTGGKTLFEIEDVTLNSEIQNDDSYGVLKLTLHPKGYEWAFISEGTFTDSGSADCH